MMRCVPRTNIVESEKTEIRASVLSDVARAIVGLDKFAKRSAACAYATHGATPMKIVSAASIVLRALASGAVEWAMPTTVLSMRWVVPEHAIPPLTHVSYRSFVVTLWTSVHCNFQTLSLIHI